MKKPIIVMARKRFNHEEDLVKMWEYDSHQETEAIMKYRMLTTDSNYDDVYFAYIHKEKH